MPRPAQPHFLVHSIIHDRFKEFSSTVHTHYTQSIHSHTTTMVSFAIRKNNPFKTAKGKKGEIRLPVNTQSSNKPKTAACSRLACLHASQELQATFTKNTFFTFTKTLQAGMPKNCSIKTCADSKSFTRLLTKCVSLSNILQVKDEKCRAGTNNVSHYLWSLHWLIN